MALLQVKKEFTRRELIWFGLLFVLFLAIVSLALISRLQWYLPAYGLLVAGGILICFYYLLPKIRIPVYRGWIYSVVPIGWVISHFLLAVIFYLLVTPIGLIMRLVGYDPMKYELDRSATSYWSARETKKKPDHYFKQF